MNSYRNRIIKKAQEKQTDRTQRNLSISKRIYERFAAKVPEGLTVSDLVEEMMLDFIDEDESKAKVKG